LFPPLPFAAPVSDRHLVFAVALRSAGLQRGILFSFLTLSSRTHPVFPDGVRDLLSLVSAASSASGLLP